MDHEDFIVAEDKLEKTLLKAENVSLLGIPPPKQEDYIDQKIVDICDWDLSAVVWSGKLKFVETEFIMNMDVHSVDERSIIQGNVILINSGDGDIFGNIPYTFDGHNIKVTDSKTIYSVILEHQNKKIGFGLVFKDPVKADDFNIALQNYRKDAKAALETHNDFLNDLEEGVKNLQLDQTSPSEVKTDELLPGDDVKKVSEHDNDTEDSDLEFGDFVGGEN